MKCVVLHSGSFTSVSPACSISARQTGTHPDSFEAPPSPRYSFTDTVTANMGGLVTFEAPELPEETLMEVRSVKLIKSGLWEDIQNALFLLSVWEQQEHTDTVQRLRFTLEFTHCLMEVAGARGVAAGAPGDLSHLSLLQQQSLVADQISSLSREWR